MCSLFLFITVDYNNLCAISVCWWWWCVAVCSLYAHHVHCVLCAHSSYRFGYIHFEKSIYFHVGQNLKWNTKHIPYSSDKFIRTVKTFAIKDGMVKQHRMLLVPFASLKCNKDPALKRWTTNDDQAKPINISRSLGRDARALSSQKPLKKFLKVKPWQKKWKKTSRNELSKRKTQARQEKQKKTSGQRMHNAIMVLFNYCSLHSD